MRIIPPRLKSQYGLSTIPVAILLVLAGAVIWFMAHTLAASKEYTRHTMTVLQVRSLVASTYSMSDTTLDACTQRAWLDRILEHMEIRVEGLVTDQKTLHHPWGGNLTPVPFCKAGNTVDSWTLIFDGVPQTSCTDLLNDIPAINKGWFGVWGVVDGDKKVFNAPISDEIATSYCKKANGVIIFAMTLPGHDFHGHSIKTPAAALNGTALPDAYKRQQDATRKSEE